MRRMIKETEISKLDAINTNDLAKLDNISEADIQRLNNLTDEDVARLNNLTDADVARLNNLTDADVARLNNITDADVARLNKLTDNDVNKIQSITNADIQSVKAMESPKNATADYVLTADGTGKATYKPAKGGGGGGKSYIFNMSGEYYNTSVTFSQNNGSFPEIPDTWYYGEFFYGNLSGAHESVISVQIINMIENNSGNSIENGQISSMGIIIEYYDSSNIRIFVSVDVMDRLNLLGGGEVVVNAYIQKLALQELGA